MELHVKSQEPELLMLVHAQPDTLEPTVKHIMLATTIHVTMAELVKQMETAISAYVHNFTPVLTVKHLQMLALQTHV